MNYDVIVAGASVGGLNAAYHAAKDGASVLVLDEKENLGDFKCAEAVFDMHLAQVGIEEDPAWCSLEFRKLSLTAPNGKTVQVITKVRHGIILDRRRFQDWMVIRAADAGATIKNPEKVKEFNLEEGYIRTSKGEYNAEAFIDATGIHAWLGRTVDPGLKTIPRDEFAPVFQRTVKADLPQYDDGIFLWFGEANHAPGGYCWIFPKGDGTYNIGLGGVSDLIRRQKLTALLDDFMEEHVPGGWTELYHVGSRLPLAQPLKQYRYNSAVADLFLIGDAARLCWPLSGAGIFTALMSGKLAGEMWNKGHHYDAEIKRRWSKKQRVAFDMLLKHRTDAGQNSLIRKIRFIMWFHRFAPRWFEERAFGSWRLV